MGVLRLARPKNDDRGAAAVEFALVVPLLLMILFGMITFGRTYNDSLSIANATREGARLGGALDYSTAPSTWATSVQQRVSDTYFNAMSTLPVSKICVQLVDSNGNVVGVSGVQASALGADCLSTTAPAVPSGLAAGSCVVRVWVVKEATLSWLLVPDKIIDLSSSSVAGYGLKAGSCTAN